MERLEKIGDDSYGNWCGSRFDSKRGFGFVIPDDGGEDLFVHQNNIIMEGFRSLRSGERVKFEIEMGDKGGKAVSVELFGNASGRG